MKVKNIADDADNVFRCLAQGLSGNQLSEEKEKVQAAKFRAYSSEFIRTKRNVQILNMTFEKWVEYDSKGSFYDYVVRLTQKQRVNGPIEFMLLANYTDYAIAVFEEPSNIRGRALAAGSLKLTRKFCPGFGTQDCSEKVESTACVLHNGKGHYDSLAPCYIPGVVLKTRPTSAPTSSPTSSPTSPPTDKPYTFRRIAGDGHCAYRAISQGMNNGKLSFSDETKMAAELRAKACDLLVEKRFTMMGNSNTTLEQQVVMANGGGPNESEIFNKYLKGMREGAWGGALEFGLLAEYYNMTIGVFQKCAMANCA